MKNKFYWLIKRFDEPMLNHIKKHFTIEASMDFMRRFENLGNKIFALQKENIPPDSESAQSLAESFWDMVLEFTGGDISMFPRLMKFTEANKNGSK